MRIDRRSHSGDKIRELSRDIAEAACARGVDGRVCSKACAMKCPRCGSTTCGCACSPDCPDAPRALSSDPDNYPVEPNITPLVFEMTRLGMFRPCWSCEGHLRPNGSLWKIPRVWFYCDSTVHIRLLTDGIKELEKDGKIQASWQVAVTFSDSDNPETTFSLEPALSRDAKLGLPALRKDARTIAAALRGMMNDGARRLQRETGAVLAGAR